ncbi:MAG: hypothetical protein ABR559_06630 [Gemmatimonadota bacterium]
MRMLEGGPDLAPGADGAQAESALAALEERIMLLIARHQGVQERLATKEAAARRIADGADPLALEARVRELEGENDRLTRHAEFLERQVRGLRGRVRYALEG